VNNLNLRWTLWIVVAFSGIAWLVVARISGLDISQIANFLSIIPKVVTVDLVAVTLFVKWGWRLRLFHGWLVSFPDLAGTWIGTIQSDWIDPQTSQPIPPIPTMLTVAQSFFHVSCVMRTGEMRSDSYSEGFRIDKDRQLRQIAYSYTARPRLSVAGRSAPHDGSVVFDVVERPRRKLKGRYWTERKTTGEIELTFNTRSLLEELPERLPEHPLQASDAR
jgi:hypothetical protein